MPLATLYLINTVIIEVLENMKMLKISCVCFSCTVITWGYDVNDCSAGCNGVDELMSSKRIHRASSHLDTNCECTFVSIVSVVYL